MSYLIELDEPAGAGVQRVLEEQRARVLSFLLHWEDEPASAVHKARQACKRARAVAQLLKTAAPYVAMVENSFFRGIQQGVAYARDNEALVEALDFLLAGVSEPRVRESVTMLRDSCAARAAQSLQESRGTLRAQVDAACEQLRSAERRLARLPGVDLRRRDLRRGARRTWKLCVAGYLELKPDSPPDGYHAWRRQVKYAYSQSRLLAAVPPFDIETPLLQKLSATLGHCQDLELLECLLRGQPDALRIDTHLHRLRRLIQEWMQRLREEALDVGGRLFQPADDMFVTEQKQSGKHSAIETLKHSQSSTGRANPDRGPHSSRRWQLR